MTLLAVPVWALALWAALVAPGDAIGWAVGGGVSVVALVWLAVSGSLGRTSNPITALIQAGRPPWRTLASLLSGAPRQAAMLMFGGAKAAFVRVRRPASTPGQPALAAALSLAPGVQLLHADADGLLVHVLSDSPASYDQIAAHDPVGDGLDGRAT